MQSRFVPNNDGNNNGLKEIMIAEPMKNTEVFGDIVLRINGLHIRFENATSGF
jgi:hypothetical protein